MYTMPLPARKYAFAFYIMCRNPSLQAFFARFGNFTRPAICSTLEMVAIMLPYLKGTETYPHRTISLQPLYSKVKYVSNMSNNPQQTTMLC